MKRLKPYQGWIQHESMGGAKSLKHVIKYCIHHCVEIVERKYTFSLCNPEKLLT